MMDFYRVVRSIIRAVIPYSIRRTVVQVKRRYWSFFSDLVTTKFVPPEIPKAKFDVVCFPIIDWDFRFQRPQQLMTQFARDDHRVFYVQQNFRATGPAYKIIQKAPNLFEVSLRGPQVNVYRDLLSEKESHALLSSLDDLRRDYGISTALSCVQLPFWEPLARLSRSKFSWPILYDCMDFHAGFSSDHYNLLTAEVSLLSQADQVVVSSTTLQEYAAPYNSKIELIRNGCDYEHFSRATQAETNRDKQVRPVVGYYGAIAEWFDVELVTELATRKSEWDFILIDAVTINTISDLRRLPNVTFTNEVPYQELPDWLAKIDVTIIPFKRTALTEATNPVKVYETLAAGKPVVATPLPEIVALGKIAQTAETGLEFEAQIAQALIENTPALVASRQAFAAHHTWQKRYAHLQSLTKNIFPKASIIIVTYNNLSLNRICLQYLYEQTEWPDFETIVVDNASTDGTVEFLREAQTLYPQLKVILNTENLGFAKANNIGLQLASGEYLVLLNNDTAVARGWLSNFIRHLNSDKTIGLLGPVTNEIGNEAKIPVGYANLQEMPTWAVHHVRKHDGQLFEIPMLAMYCLAMRREVYEEIGALDERFGIGMFEDDDYTRRARELGYKVICAKDVFIHHVGRASFKLQSEAVYQEIFDKNRKLYEEKWKENWVPHKSA
jgi:GT2 family glycosyltransferase/glycosyltransferase involved in cell wall biosynthesis